MVRVFSGIQPTGSLHLGNYLGEKYGPGWAWEDYPYYFSPEISSVPLYGNVVHIEYNDSLTMFPNVIEALKLDMTIIEEEILLLEEYDFTYNHKKVVTKVEKHQDLI